MGAPALITCGSVRVFISFQPSYDSGGAGGSDERYLAAGENHGANGGLQKSRLAARRLTAAAKAVVQKQASYRSGEPLRHPKAKAKSKIEINIKGKIEINIKGKIPGWTLPWNPTLAHKTRKDGAHATLRPPVQIRLLKADLEDCASCSY
jgi:hypothetical protein